MPGGGGGPISQVVEALVGHGMDKAGEAIARRHKEVGNGGADGYGKDLAGMEGVKDAGRAGCGGVICYQGEQRMREAGRWLAKDTRCVRAAVARDGDCIGWRFAWAEGCNVWFILATLNWS